MPQSPLSTLLFRRNHSQPLPPSSGGGGAAAAGRKGAQPPLHGRPPSPLNRIAAACWYLFALIMGWPLRGAGALARCMLPTRQAAPNSASSPPPTPPTPERRSARCCMYSQCRRAVRCCVGFTVYLLLFIAAVAAIAGLAFYRCYSPDHAAHFHDYFSYAQHASSAFLLEDLMGEAGGAVSPMAGIDDANARTHAGNQGVGGAVVSDQCWCAPHLEVAWGVAVAWDVSLREGTARKSRRRLIRPRDYSSPSATTPRVFAAPVIVHRTGANSTRRHNVHAYGDGRRGASVRFTPTMAASSPSPLPTTMHVYRAPCDTKAHLYRSGRAKGSDGADGANPLLSMFSLYGAPTRPHRPFLRGVFEMCARDGADPLSPHPYGGALDARSDVVPSCAERAVRVAEEVADYWDGAFLFPAHHRHHQGGGGGDGDEEREGALPSVEALMGDWRREPCTCSGGGARDGAAAASDADGFVLADVSLSDFAELTRRYDEAIAKAGAATRPIPSDDHHTNNTHLLLSMLPYQLVHRALLKRQRAMYAEEGATAEGGRREGRKGGAGNTSSNGAIHHVMLPQALLPPSSYTPLLDVAVPRSGGGGGGGGDYHHRFESTLLTNPNGLAHPSRDALCGLEREEGEEGGDDTELTVAERYPSIVLLPHEEGAGMREMGEGAPSASSSSRRQWHVPSSEAVEAGSESPFSTLRRLLEGDGLPQWPGAGGSGGSGSDRSVGLSAEEDQRRARIEAALVRMASTPSPSSSSSGSTSSLSTVSVFETIFGGRADSGSGGGRGTPAQTPHTRSLRSLRRALLSFTSTPSVLSVDDLLWYGDRVLMDGPMRLALGTDGASPQLASGVSGPFFTKGLWRRLFAAQHRMYASTETTTRTRNPSQPPLPPVVGHSLLWQDGVDAAAHVSFWRRFVWWVRAMLHHHLGGPEWLWGIQRPATVYHAPSPTPTATRGDGAAAGVAPPPLHSAADRRAVDAPVRLALMASTIAHGLALPPPLQPHHRGGGSRVSDAERALRRLPRVHPKDGAAVDAFLAEPHEDDEEGGIGVGVSSSSSFSFSPLSSLIPIPSAMRRDEVAMDFCLARSHLTASKRAMGATGGSRSGSSGSGSGSGSSPPPLPSLRRSLLLSTLNGAPVLCYESNDYVCSRLQAEGVWEAHIHTAMRAAVLSIRGEVRMAATILKEREGVLRKKMEMRGRGGGGEAKEGSGAASPVSSSNSPLFDEVALVEAMLGQEEAVGPMRAWHPHAAEVLLPLSSSTATEEEERRHRSPSVDSIKAYGKYLLQHSKKRKGMFARNGRGALSSSAVEYDRFAFFLRDSGSGNGAKEDGASSIIASGDALSTPFSSASCISPEQAVMLRDMDVEVSTAKSSSSSSSSPSASLSAVSYSPPPPPLTTSFIRQWLAHSVEFQRRHSVGAAPSPSPLGRPPSPLIAPAIIPEVYDRRIDVEFVTEDMMGTLQRLSIGGSISRRGVARGVRGRGGPPPPPRQAKAVGSSHSTGVEVPIIPSLLLPSFVSPQPAVPPSSSSSSSSSPLLLRVRGDRTAYDGDVLFMDVGSNVGSFAMDVRLGGGRGDGSGSGPRGANNKYVPPTAADDDGDGDDVFARLHTNSPSSHSPPSPPFVMNGAAVTNMMLLEAFPGNIYVLEAGVCLNAVREYSVWRRAVHTVAMLFDGLICGNGNRDSVGGTNKGAVPCRSKVSVGFGPAIGGKGSGSGSGGGGWADIPAQVTAEGFHAAVTITSSPVSNNTVATALAHHHELLRQYLAAISSRCRHATARRSTAGKSATDGSGSLSTLVTCEPPRWAPTLHHAALGDGGGASGDDEGVLSSSPAAAEGSAPKASIDGNSPTNNKAAPPPPSWCVLTASRGNMADTVLSCKPEDVERSHRIAGFLADAKVAMGNPMSFLVLPLDELIDGKRVPLSFVQIRTLDSVVRERSHTLGGGESKGEEGGDDADADGAEGGYAARAIRVLLAPRGVPPSFLNKAMARRFAGLIKAAEKAIRRRGAGGDSAQQRSTAATAMMRPSRASSLLDLLAYACIAKPFLKVDVEGFEPLVLKGLSATMGNAWARPLMLLQESWQSEAFVEQGRRMVERYGYVGISIEEGRGHWKWAQLIVSAEDVEAFNAKGKGLNTVVWVQRGYEDFVPLLSTEGRRAAGG